MYPFTSPYSYPRTRRSIPLWIYSCKNSNFQALTLAIMPKNQYSSLAFVSLPTDLTCILLWTNNYKWNFILINVYNLFILWRRVVIYNLEYFTFFKRVWIKQTTCIFSNWFSICWVLTRTFPTFIENKKVKLITIRITTKTRAIIMFIINCISWAIYTT